MKLHPFFYFLGLQIFATLFSGLVWAADVAPAETRPFPEEGKIEVQKDRPTPQRKMFPVTVKKVTEEVQHDD